jgi:hypothetical protein
MEKFAFILFAAVFSAGCSTRFSHDGQFAQTLRELRAADVSQWPNSLLVGESFPSGRTLAVSDAQARRLQGVFLAARPVAKKRDDFGKTISPAPRLCALTLAGQTWYFLPPGHPVRFALPAPQQEEFESILRSEFGLGG